VNAHFKPNAVFLAPQDQYVNYLKLRTILTCYYVFSHELKDVKSIISLK